MNMCNKEDLQKLPYKFQVMFAIFCARQVIHLILEKDREVCIKAIEAAEGFIEERTSKEECAYTANAAYAAANAANAAAYAAAYTAAYAAAYTAAYAAYAAASAAPAAYTAYTAAAANAAYTAAAANAAVKQKIIQEQWDYYNELLNFEANFEEILLGE